MMSLDSELVSPSGENSLMFASFTNNLTARLSAALSKHSKTQNNWTNQIAILHQLRTKQDINGTSMHKKVSKKLKAKNIPSMVER